MQIVCRIRDNSYFSISLIYQIHPFCRNFSNFGNLPKTQQFVSTHNEVGKKERKARERKMQLIQVLVLILEN